MVSYTALTHHTGAARLKCYNRISISFLILWGLPVIAGIGQFLDLSKTAGMSPALRGFRKWIREQGIVNSGIN